MNKITMVGGNSVELSVADGIRLKKMLQRNYRNLRVLDSGLVINLDHIAIIDLENAEPVPEPVVETEPIPEIVPEPSDRMHIGQIKAIMDDNNLSQAQFAESVNYSPATMRMAMKEGRISQQFSDAIRDKYDVKS